MGKPFWIVEFDSIKRKYGQTCRNQGKTRFLARPQNSALAAR
jgi:hypothetical protein